MLLKRGTTNFKVLIVVPVKDQDKANISSPNKSFFTVAWCIKLHYLLIFKKGITQVFPQLKLN